MTYESVNVTFGIAVVVLGLFVGFGLGITLVIFFKFRNALMFFLVLMLGFAGPIVAGAMYYQVTLDNAYQAGVRNIQQKYNVTDVEWSTLSSGGDSINPGSQKDRAITVTTVDGQKVEVRYRVNDQNEPFLSNMPLRAGDSKAPIIDAESLKK